MSESVTMILDINYYRNNYFLDPKGSNAELFLNQANKILVKLLSMYTGKDFQIDMKLNEGDFTTQIKVRDETSTEQIKRKVAKFGYKMPEHGVSLDHLRDDLSDLLSSEICFNPEFIGQMHPHDNIASFVAGIAGKFLNGNTIAEEVSRVTTYLEKQTIAWLAQSFGYKPDISWMTTVVDRKPLASGNITAGGTTANLTALIVARNKAFPDELFTIGAAHAGLHDAAVVFGSEYSHYSIEKLCGYIGIGSDNFKKIKAPDKRMLLRGTDSLEEKMWHAGRIKKKVVAVVATAGLTETGNIDDLYGIKKLIDKFEREFGYRPHFHVDAAHGGGFIFHPDFNIRDGKFKGIQHADSITIDPHKMLYVHYTAGAILFKDRKDHALLKQNADYLFKNNGCNDLGQFRVEGSMGLEGALQTWASLYALGKEGYQVIQDHVLQMTAYMKQQIKGNPNFQLLHYPEMNLLAFRYYNPRFSEPLNDEINSKAQKVMYDRGNAYISNDGLLHRKDESDPGRKMQVFRAVVIHPYTTEKEIDLALNEVTMSVEKVLDEIALNAAYAKNKFEPIPVGG
ncbi:aspartate aminotransferase family protein [Candidatus Woesearchaeota archaeon]|nr:MAG: aspartate aminotransferase family protein [Candidatus Woesearchaeota archaeon]